jgi:hypothetical protein
MYVAAHELADGYPDPETGECTALSSSYTIETIPAFIIRPEQDDLKTSEVIAMPDTMQLATRGE